MTAAELILELQKVEPGSEVWIDTSEGLVAVDGVYEVLADIDTVIITYRDNTYEGIKQ